MSDSEYQLVLDEVERIRRKRSAIKQCARALEQDGCVDGESTAPLDSIVVKKMKKDAAKRLGSFFLSHYRRIQNSPTGER